MYVYVLLAVEEKGGFVWVFFGSAALPADERPPIPYVPELGEWASRCQSLHAICTMPYAQAEATVKAGQKC